MAQDWYYTRNGHRHGPVSGADLKQLAASGKLQPTDHVWKEGMDKWAAARSVKGLFPATGVSVATTAPPPPLPDRKSSPPAEDRKPASEPAEPPKMSGRKISTPALVGIVGGGVLLLAVLVTVPVLILANKSNPAGGQGQAPENPDRPKVEGSATRPGRSDSPHPRFAEAAKEADALFANADYSKGPTGEGLEYKEWTEGEFKIKAQGFRQGTKFIKHGLVTVWYANGQKESEAYWFNDKRHGPISVWHRNGQKMREGHNKDGFVDGYSVEWYDGDGKKMEGVYQKGRTEGMFITYYRSGGVMRESEYKNGKLVHTPTANSSIPSETWYDGQGGKATGPTIRALKKEDFLEVLDYRLKNDLGRSVVHGSISPPDPRYGREKYEILLNFEADYFMKYIGRPESGFDPDFANHALQVWNYPCADGVLTLRVEYAGTRVIVRGINL